MGSKQQGMALLLVLVAVLLLSALTIMAIEQSDTDGKLAHHQHHQATLFTLADKPISMMRQPNMLAKQQEADGVIAKILAQAEHGTPNSLASTMLVGGGCYQRDLGEKSLSARHIVIADAVAKLQCQGTPDVVRFWLVVSKNTGDDGMDWQSVPEGVDLSLLSSNQMTDRYQLHMYSLAYRPNPSQEHQIQACMQDHRQVADCLSKLGVAYQLLVQEFGE